MCGIAGIVSITSERAIDGRLIERMTDKVVHRGPDSAGVWVEGGVGFGHRRLSIIDLSAVANQPLFNEDGTIAIIFNGEIYNFQSLMEDLLLRGHIFKSRSDTEVIVHLYEEYGLDCLARLRGMFAFAIWDARLDRLLLARDRVGKKPLYYHLDGDTLSFASEIKSILECPWVKAEVNWRAIDCFFGLQYIPAPMTAFEGISKLPPAHYALFGRKSPLSIQRYWAPEPEPQDTDLALSQKKLKDMLYEAVSLRMVSDVPLGAFLSGGVDSSLVVAIMSELSREKVKTFSIGFSDARFNELPFAKKAAEICSTEHREFIIHPDICHVLPTLIWHYNEPFGDSSCIPTYYLSQVTRSEVTVALSGDGGDELFGGYQRYVDLKKMSFLDHLGMSFSNIESKPRNLRSRIATSLKIRLADSKSRNFGWITVFNHSMRQRLYSRQLVERLADDHPWRHYSRIWDGVDTGEAVETAARTDFALYLPDDILVKVDVASMANALEVRVPFLDQHIVNFAMGLPLSSKIGFVENKRILRALAADYFPPDFIDRRKKGFSIPIHAWMRHELFDIVVKVILSSREALEDFFNFSEIEELLNEHKRSGGLGTHIWLLLNFVLWHKLFIQGEDITEVFASSRQGAIETGGASRLMVS